jgi:pentatricopeptide repeat protein
VMPERNAVSWNSMVAGLIRNGDLEEARLVFQLMPDKNTVSWNTMIAGYAENCRMEEAKALFDEMQERNLVTWTSMITGYCRMGNVEEAYCLFQRMPERNIVSWTAMIGGFTWNGFYKEALLLFLEMRVDFDVKPNGETFISFPYACAGVVFNRPGMQLHAQLVINSWDYDDYDGRLSRSLVAPRLYLMKGESGNLQLPLSTTISSSISSEIINLAAEFFYFFFYTTLTKHIRADYKTSILNRFLHYIL